MNKINAGHGGIFQFRICNADGIENPGEECFDGNYLMDKDGNYEFRQPSLSQNSESVKKLEWHDKVGAINKIEPQWMKVLMYVFRLELPANLTCDHCIFQVL